MASKQRRRDPRYTRTVGEKPHSGRRYVEQGKVRIEWYENGKRRSRTIGDNSADARRKADAQLEEILGIRAESEETPSLEETVRGVALSLLDVADRAADWVEEAMSRLRNQR